MKPQYMCSEIIQLQLLEVEGRVQTSTGILEEIAPASACIQTEGPVPEGTMLRMVCPGSTPPCQFQGKVVECWHRERLGYFVQVEFEPGNEWRAEMYAPAHLLDTASLLAEQQKTIAKKSKKTSLLNEKFRPELVKV